MKNRTPVVEIVDNDMAEVLRNKSEWERLKIIDSLLRGARVLIESNVRETHPDWDDRQVQAAIAARIAGGPY